MNVEVLKNIVPTVIHQKIEFVTFGSESQSFSTEISWDLYMQGGDNVFNSKGRPKLSGSKLAPCIFIFMYYICTYLKRNGSLLVPCSITACGRAYSWISVYFKDRQQVITAVLPWAQLNTLYEFLSYPSYF